MSVQHGGALVAGLKLSRFCRGVLAPWCAPGGQKHETWRFKGLLGLVDQQPIQGVLLPVAL